MGVNKEDFRHFMLDSHKSVGQVLLSKESLEKCSVWVQEKILLCLSAVCGIHCQGGQRQHLVPPFLPRHRQVGKAEFRGQGMGVSHEGWAILLSAVNLHKAFDVGGSGWWVGAGAL